MPRAPDHPRDADRPISDEEIALATAIVGGFVATRPWLREDRKDLEQDCFELWLRRRHRYDASRGASLRTFMRRVLERHLLNVERSRTANKRGGGDQPVSLDEEDDEQTSLHDVLAGSEDTERAVLWALAFERVRERLSEIERELLRELTSGRSMTEISRHATRARSSLYRDLERIREAFKEEGLDEFL